MPKDKDDDKPSKKKKQPKKASRKRASEESEFEAAPAPELAAQPCLSLTAAAFIVGGCLPSGSHGNDDTLEETGLITENLRLIFRECVFNAVNSGGCEIDRGQIPNGADDEVGDVIDAVFRNSR